MVTNSTWKLFVAKETVSACSWIRMRYGRSFVANECRTCPHESCVTALGQYLGELLVVESALGEARLLRAKHLAREAATLQKRTHAMWHLVREAATLQHRAQNSCHAPWDILCGKPLPYVASCAGSRHPAKTHTMRHVVSCAGTHHPANRAQKLLPCAMWHLSREAAAM